MLVFSFRGCKLEFSKIAPEKRRQPLLQQDPLFRYLYVQYFATQSSLGEIWLDTLIPAELQSLETATSWYRSRALRHILASQWTFGTSWASKKKKVVFRCFAKMCSDWAVLKFLQSPSNVWVISTAVIRLFQAYRRRLSDTDTDNKQNSRWVESTLTFLHVRFGQQYI